MHCQLKDPQNSPQGENDLSLLSSTFQSKSKNSGATTTTHYNPKTNSTKKTWWPNPNRRNLKKSHINCWDCSTSLELYDDPWKIKKVLTKSDVGKLNRLLFGADLLENLMLPVLGADAQRGMGTPIRVWDADTMTMHALILKRWASFQNFVLIGGWNRNFVKRRGLKKGDEIGLLWDSSTGCFHFSVLKRTE
ncbi:B3 domain-containing protein At2g33720-like [Abrus precatorius]|uniref:B3 domain-containing protein At2g33720-like n=1 Tax=Abrus precatorius TaxID=3816 RepID=A0A8B8K764_ABRPR|nr:B3 domain-containing protein At2g33720-like [Abrus precatorius]